MSNILIAFVIDESSTRRMIVLGETEIFQKIISYCQFSKINPTEIALDSTSGLLSDKSVNNRLNHHTARKKKDVNHLGENTVSQIRRPKCDESFHYYIS